MATKNSKTEKSEKTKTQKAKKMHMEDDDIKANPKNTIAAKYPLQLGALEFERALCLDKHATSQLRGDGEVFLCDNFLKIDSQSVKPGEHLSIGMDALQKLFKTSGNLRTHPCNILGLKAIFGANEEDKTIHVFFQPICLKLISEIIDAGLQNQGIFEILAFGPVYEYQNSAFQTASPDDYISYYQNKLRILHNDEDEWGQFTSGKDVESVIFSFQEIFNFMETNSLSTLKIVNCIRRFDTVNKGLVNKHSLILADRKPTGTAPQASKNAKAANMYKGKYSNLTHLCPPNCAQLIHPLERLEF